MALPKIVHPRFELKIPSTGRIVKFRPFTVREEKLLLMTREAKDSNMIVDTYKQIIANCVEDELDVSTLAMFDIEYFFLKLRAKSVSNISTIVISDPDGEEYTIDINLDEVEITFDPNHMNTFMLTDTLGIKMKYPTFDAIRAYENAASMVEDEEMSTRAGSFATIRACIECLFEGDTIYPISETPTAEVDEFISDLNAEQLQKIKTFMDTLPKLLYTGTYQRKDGSEGSIQIEGLQSFF